MNRLFPTLVAVAMGLTSLAGCAPSTTYNRGLDISFHPSAKADAGPRLVDSAVELKTSADDQALRDAGAVYLGELEVTGHRAGAAFTGAGSGAGTLSGRLSLEAASRGATHFESVSSNVTYTSLRSSTSEVRVVLYRLEPDAWAALQPSLRPVPAATSRVASE